MKKRTLFAFVIGIATGWGACFVTMACFPGCSQTWRNTVREAEVANEPTLWARPDEVEGVGNFHRVSPTLYRGAQPTAEGMAGLKAIGINTVVNLRKFHSDRDDIGELGLGYEHMYVSPFSPDEKEMVRFLQIVANPSNQPVFVHCWHGSDRTGMMSALYRVAIEGWTKEQAIDEWTRGGFGFHSMYENLVSFFRDLDIDDIKRRAGMAELQGTARAE